MAVATNWHERGVQDYLIGKHMPDRLARGYPTRDTASEQDETEFIAGWQEAKRDDELQAHSAGLWD